MSNDVNICLMLCNNTKRSILVYLVSDQKAFIILQLNLTASGNGVSVAVQQYSFRRENAALTINKNLGNTGLVVLCQCIQFQSGRGEMHGLITVSGLLYC